MANLYTQAMMVAFAKYFGFHLHSPMHGVCCFCRRKGAPENFDHERKEAMRTITLKQNQYRWHELSDAAKDYVRNTYFADYSLGDDAIASLKAFALHFGSKLADRSIDWSGSSPSSARFANVALEPEELERVIGELKHDGSGQFTGYCADDDCNEGAVKAYRAGERDVMEILQAGFDSWLRAAQSDYAGSLGDAAMSETCEAKDYWFDRSGLLV